MDRDAAQHLLSAAAAIQSDAARLNVDQVSRQGPIAFRSLITDLGLRQATERLYMDGHYARAVEEGMKYVAEQVRRRTSLTIDGAALMETAFSPGSPMLRLNDLKSQSDEDEQRGFMLIFSGSVAAIRNPRAHRHGHEDSPEVALELLIWTNHLTRLVSGARARRRPMRSSRAKSARTSSATATPAAPRSNGGTGA
jgi:uncharacterized protein (TIGR02391 family)